MIVLDEKTVSRIKQMRRREEAEEQRIKWIEKQEALEKFTDSDNSPFDDVRRFGHPMPTPEFERRLRKLNPNLIFRWGLMKTDHKWLMVRKGSNVEHLMTYPNPVLPERSLWRRNLQVRYDEKYGRPHLPGGIAMNKHDYSEQNREWVPADQELTNNLNARAGTKFTLKQMQSAWEPNGQGVGRWVYRDPDQAPGMKKVTLPWGEFLRGRRTVLLRLVKEGYLSVDQVEREFGSDDTPEWKGHTGRGAILRPW